jgi:hypothetical protein
MERKTKPDLAALLTALSISSGSVLSQGVPASSQAQSSTSSAEDKTHISEKKTVKGSRGGKVKRSRDQKCIDCTCGCGKSGLQKNGRKLSGKKRNNTASPVTDDSKSVPSSEKAN